MTDTAKFSKLIDEATAILKTNPEIISLPIRNANSLWSILSKSYFHDQEKNTTVRFELLN